MKLARPVTIETQVRNGNPGPDWEGSRVLPVSFLAGVEYDDTPANLARAEALHHFHTRRNVESRVTVYLRTQGNEKCHSAQTLEGLSTP